MELIEKVSYNIALKLGNKTNKTEEEISIINYGMFMILHTTMSMIFTILVGILIKKPIEIIVITIVAASLKRYSGGVHATSPNRCLVTGILAALILTNCSTLLSRNSSIVNLIIINLIVTAVSAIIFYKRAPIGNKNKPLKSKAIRLRLRKKLLVVLVSYYIIIAFLIFLMIKGAISLKYNIYVYCLQLGILLQTFSLTNVGEFTICKIDKFLKRLM